MISTDLKSNTLNTPMRSRALITDSTAPLTIPYMINTFRPAKFNMKNYGILQLYEDVLSDTEALLHSGRRVDCKEINHDNLQTESDQPRFEQLHFSVCFGFL
jgi:hypothetical protein